MLSVLYEDNSHGVYRVPMSWLVTGYALAYMHTHTEDMALMAIYT